MTTRLAALGHVQSWMTPEVVATGPDEPAIRALELMAERGIRHVLVRRGAAVVGIVSNRDVIRATGQKGDGPLDLQVHTVADIMTPAPLETTWPGATLCEAARRMRAARISALPVMDGAELVGILTTDDLLAAVAEDEVEE